MFFTHCRLLGHTAYKMVKWPVQVKDQLFTSDALVFAAKTVFICNDCHIFSVNSAFLQNEKGTCELQNHT